MTEEEISLSDLEFTDSDGEGDVGEGQMREIEIGDDEGEGDGKEVIEMGDFEGLEVVFVSAQNPRQAVSEGGKKLIQQLKPLIVHWTNYSFLKE